MSTKARRQFTPEQKAEAVRIVSQSGKSIGQIAREMGLTESALRKWLTAIAEWIEVFYNRQQIHLKLNYLSPVQFEQQYWLSLQQSRAA